jgi:hypothetical protein
MEDFENSVFKGLAICRDGRFCAQSYDVCSECPDRDRFKCKDAIITVEFLDIKESSGNGKYPKSVKTLNEGIIKVVKATRKLSRVK